MLFCVVLVFVAELGRRERAEEPIPRRRSALRVFPEFAISLGSFVSRYFASVLGAVHQVKAAAACPLSIIARR